MIPHFKIRFVLTLIVVLASLQYTTANTKELVDNHGHIDVIVNSEDATDNEITESNPALQNELNISGEENKIRFGSNEKVTLKASKKIVFKPGTKITAGAEVHASIMQQPLEKETEKNSTQQLLDIVKKHKDNEIKNEGRENQNKKKEIRKEKLNKQLLFLLNTYEQLCQTKGRINNVLDKEGKKRDSYITASHIQGISSENNNRINTVKQITLRALPGVNIIKTNYRPVISPFNPEVNMVLRL